MTIFFAVWQTSRGKRYSVITACDSWFVLYDRLLAPSGCYSGQGR